ncbi:MAG: acetate--CoA ligase [Chloroflexota bacterium]|nr:acetate--CoA ligase [Chloroflexota bacterium]
MLDMFSNPRSIAVIGASADPQKLGNAVLVNLIESGFEGELYPINLKENEILGLKAYPSVLDVSGSIDLVVIVVPSQFVADVLEESGQKGVKGAIIISAGFGEAGPDGQKREEQLLDIAERYGMRLIGPNCLGVIDTFVPMNASFAAGMPEQGTIAFMSQSGALCTAILDYALAEHIGFSHFVSTGNKADVDEVALFEAWRDDKCTNAIIAYIEGVKNGSAFIEEAKKTARVKPIIAVKSGRTASGSQAVASHTGSLAGSDEAYDAAFKQAGVIRAATVQDLFDLSTAFAYQPPLKGNRIAIVTNAGGPGVMATDALEQEGLQLAQLQPETEQRLKEALPPAANTHNPVDVLGDARAERYGAALRAVLQDEGVDGILIILTPQTSTEIVETARAVVRVSTDSDKPIMGCWMGKQEAAAGIYDLSQNHVPNYPFPERAIAALGAMYRYNVWKQQSKTEIETFEVDKEAVRELFDEVRQDERRGIGDAEAQAILHAYGITTPKSTVAGTKDEAVAYCEEIGYPVVLKIASPDILHKSDAGGILVGVQNEAEVREGFDTLVERAKDYDPQAEIWGIQIQEMITDAQEVIVGMNRDPQFGPLIMFGLGGIYVEVLEDVTFRVAPMSRGQAKQMIQEIRSYPLLTGIRGQAPSDREAIVDTILRIAQLASDFPEIAELDINPLFVREEGKGAVAVDMRLILE